MFGQIQTYPKILKYNLKVQLKVTYAYLITLLDKQFWYNVSIFFDICRNLESIKVIYCFRMSRPEYFIYVQMISILFKVSLHRVTPILLNIYIQLHQCPQTLKQKND